MERLEMPDDERERIAKMLEVEHPLKRITHLKAENKRLKKIVDELIDGCTECPICHLTTYDQRQERCLEDRECYPCIVDFLFGKEVE